MNTLILKTTRDVVNEPVLVHIMTFNKELNKLVNIGGYEFSSVSSDNKFITLNLGDNIKHKTGEDYTLHIPTGSILRVECPKGSNPIFIEDMLHLNPTKAAEIFTRNWPNETSNVAKVIIDSDGFKVTLKEARVGTLELYEITSKDDPIKVVQRLTMNTNTSSNIYIFNPSTPINAAANYVVVRWSIADNSKPAGVGITAIDMSTAPRVTITGVDVSDGKIKINIQNLDTTAEFTAKEADVYFKYGDEVIALRGKLENGTVSGTGNVTLNGITNEILNKMSGDGIATVVLIGDVNNTVDYPINIDNIKTNPTGISINKNDITFNDSGTRMTFLVKDEKQVPGANINLNEITNEYVAGKLLYNNPTITYKDIDGTKYWEVAVDNIETIPNNRLYDTHVKVNYIEPNKIPVIISDNIQRNENSENGEDFIKAMLNTSAKFNNVNGRLEISMTGPYDIKPDQSYTIRDIKVIKDGNELYMHPRVEKVTGSNNIKITLDCTSDIGDIDSIQFRYNFANKMWSNIQDIDAPNIYSKHINEIRERIAKSNYIKDNDKIIIDDTNFIPLPNKVISIKIVGLNSKMFESDNIDKKNKSIIFKVGSLISDGSEEEDKLGFNIVFKYVYGNIEIELEKTFREIVDTIDTQKVLNLLWEIKNPEEVWGPWSEPFDNQNDPNNNHIKQYAKSLKPLYESLVDVNAYYESSINSMLPFYLNGKNLDYNKILPISRIIDKLPLVSIEEANIVWCAKVVFKPNTDGWIFNNKINDIKLEIKLWLYDEEKTLYIKFKNIKFINDQVECTNPYLANEGDIPISFNDIGIFSDGYITGLPYTTNNKNRMLNALKSYKDVSEYIDTKIDPESFSIEYSRWGSNKQILPFSAIFGTIDDYNYLEEYSKSPSNILAYEFIKNECKIFNKYDDKIGIKVKPIIIFKNRTVVKFPEKLIKYRSQSDIAILDKIIETVGIMSGPDNRYSNRYTNTTFSLVDHPYYKFVNANGDLIHDVNITEDNKYNIGNTSHNMYRHNSVTPINSDFTFKFSPNFKELHFTNGFIHKFFNDMVYSAKQFHTKDDSILRSISHIKITYIGKAITENGNNILDLNENDYKLLRKFNISNNNYILSKFNTSNSNELDNAITSMQQVKNSSRRKRKVEYHGPYSDYNSFYNISFNTNDNVDMTNTIFNLYYSSKNGTLVNEISNISSLFTNAVVNTLNTIDKYSAIYSLPNILSKYKVYDYNNENFKSIFDLKNIGIQITLESPRIIGENSRYRHDLSNPFKYSSYNNIRKFSETKYNESNNLLASPVVLQATYGISEDPNLLTPMQKILYKQVPHIIFTTSGSLTGNNNEIFNYREMLNDNCDYVIKYQVKLENSDYFIDKSLVYYMLDQSISNSLIEIDEEFKNSINIDLNTSEYLDNIFFINGGDYYTNPNSNKLNVRINKKFFNNYLDLYRLKYGNQLVLKDSSKMSEFNKLPEFTDHYKTLNIGDKYVSRVGFKGIYARGTFVTEEWESYYNQNNNGLSKIELMDRDIKNQQNLEYYPLYNNNYSKPSLNLFDESISKFTDILNYKDLSSNINLLYNETGLNWVHLKNSVVLTNDDNINLMNYIIGLTSIITPTVSTKVYDLLDIYRPYKNSYDVVKHYKNYNLFYNNLNTNINDGTGEHLSICPMQTIGDMNDLVNYGNDSFNETVIFDTNLRGLSYMSDFYPYKHFSYWFKDIGPWIPNNTNINYLNLTSYRGKLKFIYEIIEAPVSTYSSITTNKNIINGNIIKGESNLIDVKEIEDVSLDDIIQEAEIVDSDHTTSRNVEIYTNYKLNIKKYKLFNGNIIDNYINTSLKQNNNYFITNTTKNSILYKFNRNIIAISNDLKVGDSYVYVKPSSFIVFVENVKSKIRSMNISITELDRKILNIYDEKTFYAFFNSLSQPIKDLFKIKYYIAKNGNINMVTLINNVNDDVEYNTLINSSYLDDIFNGYVDDNKVSILFPTLDNLSLTVGTIPEIVRDKTLFYDNDKSILFNYNIFYPYLTNNNELKILSSIHNKFNTMVQPDAIYLTFYSNRSDNSSIFKLNFTKNMNQMSNNREVLHNLHYKLDDNYIIQSTDLSSSDNALTVYNAVNGFIENREFYVKLSFLFNGINIVSTSFTDYEYSRSTMYTRLLNNNERSRYDQMLNDTANTIDDYFYISQSFINDILKPIQSEIRRRYPNIVNG